MKQSVLCVFASLRLGVFALDRVVVRRRCELATRAWTDEGPSAGSIGE